MMLMSEPGFKELDFSELLVCITAAAPMPVESLNALESTIGRGKISELMGMTETSPVIVCNPIYGPKKAGSVGLPMPSDQGPADGPWPKAIRTCPRAKRAR